MRFLLENLGIIAFGANPKSYEPKTLGVYQIQLAAGDEFAEAEVFEEVATTEVPVLDGAHGHLLAGL